MQMKQTIQRDQAVVLFGYYAAAVGTLERGAFVQPTGTAIIQRPGVPTLVSAVSPRREPSLIVFSPPLTRSKKHVQLCTFMDI